MLTTLVKRQLVLLAALTVAALLVLGVYYAQLPTLAGVGRYTLTADLPASGGLYPTANVTYRGSTIGKVTDVEPTRRGVTATLSIDSRYKIPIDAVANVHSVSAVGEQYLDLVSDSQTRSFMPAGHVIARGTVPAEIGPALDAANRGLEALPKDKIGVVLDETAQAVGGLGPSLQRLVDATQAIAGDFRTSIQDINDIVQNSGGLLDSQVKSRNNIHTWARNLNNLSAQAARRDSNVRDILRQAAPTADQVEELFRGVRASLPQTLANLEVVFDLLKRYHHGVEQILVFLPQGASIAQAATAPYKDEAALDLALAINQPPPCLTGFIPASEWRSPADTSTAPLPSGTYCKIPQETPSNSVRGSRNIPCVDVPGKRAASPRECRDPAPYVPAGTNPWYGDPNQTLNCPALGARCDQSVRPGMVIPAPTINNGRNPAPADQVAGTPPPTSNPLTRPGSGAVHCDGQQPNPCVYTPSAPPIAVYHPQSGELVGPDGVKYDIVNSNKAGDDGWKDMLAPATGG